MTHAHRDLAAPELWTRSIERSQRRRELLPKARRENNRRKHMSAALATAMFAGTGAPFAAAQVSGNLSAQMAAESPANRAIEIREGGLPLQLGSEGALVAEVQKKLQITADGVFGPQTDAAVRAYQREAGLEVDGIVGLATWGSLFETHTASGASIGGSNIPPQARERVEQTVRQAGRQLAAQGNVQTSAPGTSVGGTTGTSVGGNSGTSVGGNTGTTVGGNTGTSVGGTTETTTSTPAPVPGGQACGSSTISAPVRGTVTSPYGPRGGRNHDGMDIAAPTGTPVRAAACGTVSLAGQQSGYGNIVCVTHTSQFTTCYAHLSRFAVSNGARVQQGQVIGYVGCTGSCTGPHLHFETRVGGQARNPAPYLGGASIPGQSAEATQKASAAKSTSTTRTSTTGSTTSTGTTATAERSGTAIGPTTETVAPGTPGAFTPADSATSADSTTPIPPDPTVDGVVTVETTSTTAPATTVTTETAPTVDPAATVTAETAPTTDPAATVTAETAPEADPAATVTAETAPAADTATVTAETAATAPAVEPTATVAAETAPAAPAADASVATDTSVAATAAPPAPAAPAATVTTPVETAPAPAPAPTPVETGPAPAPAPPVAPAPAPAEAAPAPAPAPAADASVTSATGGVSGSDASVSGGVAAGSTEVGASVDAAQ